MKEELSHVTVWGKSIPGRGNGWRLRTKEKAAEKVTPRDRYGKAVLHLNYLRKDGKIPEHMTTSVMEKSVRRKKYVREYIDIRTFKKVAENDRDR